MGVADPAAADGGRENLTRQPPDPAPVVPEHPPRPRRSTAPVLRAVPGTEPEWVSAADQISRLLGALATAELGGRAQPEPLHDGRALRAWARLEGPVFEAVRAAPAATPGAAEVSASDVATLGAAAGLLGRVLREHRVHGGGGELAGILLREARAQDTTPEHLVAQTARVHGVLDVEPCSGNALALVRAIWRAGT